MYLLAVMSCLNINNDLKDIKIYAYLIYNALMVFIINLYQAMHHSYCNHHSQIKPIFYNDASFCMSLSLQYHRRRRKKSKYKSSILLHKRIRNYLFATDQENYHTTHVVPSASILGSATKVARIIPLRGKSTNVRTIIPSRVMTTTEVVKQQSINTVHVRSSRTTSRTYNNETKYTTMTGFRMSNPGRALNDLINVSNRVCQYINLLFLKV
jgi:hypothetical protein